jgi:transcriptional regulator with XRE-family HTH domain
VIRGDSETVKTFGRRLVELRTARGLSQTALGRRVRRANSYIAQLERGRVVPSLKSLKRLANALEVDIYRLFLDASVKPESVKPLPVRVQEEPLLQLFRTLPREDRSLVLFMARQIERRASERQSASPRSSATPP